MVVIVADKLMISQCWLKQKVSLSCVGCDKDLHERVRVHMCVHVLVSGGSTGGSGGVRTPPPLMGQHPISRDPTSPDLVHHKCKISYLKFLNKLILLL